MSAGRRRGILWGLVAALLVAALVYAFRPQPVPVDAARLARGELVVTVDEEGETRIRDVFVVSAPVTGWVKRIEAEVGDEVVAGATVVAEIEPIDPAFLDLRSEVQAEADLNVARANQALAAAEFEQARAEYEFAQAELARARKLIAGATISQQALDDAERRARTTRAALATARARQQVRDFELARAEAQLLSPRESRAERGSCECVPLTAPVNGRVLGLAHESEGVIEAGAPLIEIGDPSDLEIVVDFLSIDAVQIEAGQRVIVEQWGGGAALAGEVRRVEPAGFTKISALGIEEQRTNVIIDFTSPATMWQRLGHGYQVEARVVLWEGEDVLVVLLTALFRHGDAWAVFVIDGGRARLREVQIGHRNGYDAEVRAGLAVGDEVILSPSDRVSDGVRVATRD